MLLLLERASLQVLTSVDRKVHIINYMVYSPVPRVSNSFRSTGEVRAMESAKGITNRTGMPGLI